MLSIVQQYFLYNSWYNSTRALYISTYSLFLADVLKLPVSWLPWLLAVNLIATTIGEIPTGAFADIKGRKQSFLTGVGATVVGYALYVFASGVSQPVFLVMIFAICAEILLALGFTFYSGCLDAWVVDQGRIHNTASLRRVFSRGQGYKNLLYLISGVLGAFVYFGFVYTEWFSTFLLSTLLCALLWWHARIRMDSDHHLSVDSGYQVASNTTGALSRYWQHVYESLHIIRQDVRIAILIGAYSIPFLFLQLLVFFWPFFLVHEAGIELEAESWTTPTLIIALSWILAYGARAAGNNIANLAWMTDRPVFGVTVAIALNSLPVVIFLIVPECRQCSLQTPVIYSLYLICYSIIRFGEGIIDPLRQVFLNRLLSAQHRATVLSMSSTVSMLVSASGLIVTSFLLINGFVISQIWLSVAVILLFTIPLYAVALRGRRLKR